MHCMQKRPKVHCMFLFFHVSDSRQRPKVLLPRRETYSFHVLGFLSWGSKHAEAHLQKNVIVDANLKREKPLHAVRDTV